MGRTMRARIAGRLLLLQGCWNFQGMQAVGFAYGLQPWLQHCYKDRPEEMRKALSRHLEYFNTNPYMSSLVAGMACALEEDVSRLPAEESEVARERLLVLKNNAAAALAGLGDALFWSALRPFCGALALALLMGMLLVSPPMFVVVVAIIGYLAVYNMTALILRWKGLSWGYRWKQELPLKLKEFPWQACIRGLRRAGLAFALAGLAAFYYHPPLTWLYGLPAVLVLTLFVFVKFLPLSSAQIYTAVCLLGALASVAGGR